MQQKISFKLLPSEAQDESAIKKIIANTCGKKENSITGFHLLKQSIVQGQKPFGLTLP